MPRKKLEVIPVKLEPLDEIVEAPKITSNDPVCVIKMSNLEIIFYSNVQEHIVQTIVKEIKLHET